MAVWTALNFELTGFGSPEKKKTKSNGRVQADRNRLPNLRSSRTNFLLQKHCEPFSSRPLGRISPVDLLMSIYRQDNGEVGKLWTSCTFLFSHSAGLYFICVSLLPSITLVMSAWDSKYSLGIEICPFAPILLAICIFISKNVFESLSFFFLRKLQQ